MIKDTPLQMDSVGLGEKERSGAITFPKMPDLNRRTMLKMDICGKFLGGNMYRVMKQVWV